DQGFEPRVRIGPAISGDDALVFARRAGRAVGLLGRLAQRHAVAKLEARELGAAGKGQRDERRGRRKAPARNATARSLRHLDHDGKPPSPSVSLGQLDLLRPGGLDPGATALLDPSANPDAAAFE